MWRKIYQSKKTIKLEYIIDMAFLEICFGCLDLYDDSFRVFCRFLSPRDRRSGGGGILFLSCLAFCVSVILSFRHSVILSSSLKCEILSVGTIIFYPVTLTLEFDPFFENFNLANNFWTVSARAWYFTWIFTEIRPFHGYHYFLPCDLDLGVCSIFFKLTLFITFK